jgi:hypothetical protein
MKGNPANSKIVPSSSEALLRDLLEGQSADLIEDLAMDLRIRVSLGWAGPDPSRAPIAVHRKDPDGSVSVELIRDLIAADILRWDAGRFVFVAQPGEPAEYTIPGGDDELTEVMDHPSVPEAARERLRVYQSRMRPNPGTHSRIMATIRAQLARKRPQPSKMTELNRFVAAAFVSPPVRELPTDDGKKVRVSHTSGQDQCVIELVPPLPEGMDRSEFVLRLGDRIIRPIGPISKRGYFTVWYSDIEDILTNKFE